MRSGSANSTAASATRMRQPPDEANLATLGDLRIGLVEQRSAVAPADAVGEAGNRQHRRVLPQAAAEKRRAAPPQAGSTAIARYCGATQPRSPVPHKTPGR